MVEQKRVLDLGRIADHAVVSDDHVFADVGVVPDLAVAANNGRSSDHCSVFDDGAFPDGYVLTNEGNAIAMISETRSQICLKISFDARQRLPGMLASFENAGMLGLGEIKKVRGSEHGEAGYA